MRHPFRGSVVVFLSLGVSAAAFSRELTFEKRVQAEEAIARAAYARQSGTTRPFEEAVPRRVLERRVRTYLRQSLALETLWKTPVTDEMLMRELERMTTQTRMPERLRELYATLGDDAFLIEECLARPVLVDRLARNAFGFDESLHTRERQEAESLRRDLLRSGVESFLADPRGTLVEIERSDLENAPEPRPGARDVRTIELNAETFARWRGRAPVGVGVVGPVRSERGAFVISVVLREGSGWARMAYFTVPKRSWDEWWSGVATSFDPREAHAVAEGSASKIVARLDPVELSGSSKSMFPAGSDGAWEDGALDDLPHPRATSAAVWTGSLMVVWGGYNGIVLNTGGRYDPVTDSWSAMATANAPAPCERPSASWTGRVVTVRETEPGRGDSAGGRYDPAIDAWNAVGVDPEAAADPSDVRIAPIEGAPVDSSTAGPSGGDLATSEPASTPAPAAGDQAVYEEKMPPVSSTPIGLTFPTDAPVESELFMGSQAVDFGYCAGGPRATRTCATDHDCPGGECEITADNTLCFAYNMNCAGTKVNKSEYGFNDVLEATYDHSPVPGRQTWIERNWNYTSADGTSWRPFGFALDVDANSTCEGGTNEGAYCTLLDAAGVCKGGGTCTGKPPTGQAWWSFTPNNRNGNTSLILRWPWASINARDGTDLYWANGFSSWMRTSDFDPGNSSSGARFMTYADHTNDRRGPWLNGVHSTVDFNTTNPNGMVGWLNAGYFEARISGTTPSRVIGALTGVRSEVNLASTGKPQAVGQSFGVLVQFNPSGSNIVESSHTGILVNTPAPPGPGTRIGTQNGLWIEDQQLVRSGGGGSAILISAQTTSDGSEGNLRFDGGNWSNGHVQWGGDHLWRDAAGSVLRYKRGNAPASATDGAPLVMGTSSNSHGVVFWGVSTATDPQFDTGIEVCAAAGVGLSCVETWEFSKDQVFTCEQAHTASKWIAFCK